MSSLHIASLVSDNCAKMNVTDSVSLFERACPRQERLLALYNDDNPLDLDTEKHVTHCERCDLVLDSFLIRADDLISRLRNTNPAAVYSHEPELAELKAKARDSVVDQPAPTHLCRVNDYIVLEELNSGGMGVVYRAH